MENNLIPPFIMCEAGLLVDDVASICCGENVSHYSHCIIVIEADIEVRIPLILDGIFSYFPTWSLTYEEIGNIDHVGLIFFTLDSTSWGPYDDAYEEDECNFLDKKGGII